MRVRSPRAHDLLPLLGRQASVELTGPDEIETTGVTAAEIGDLACAHGVPVHHLAEVEHSLENAYLTLGREVGLDFALANPEKAPAPLPADHPMVAKLRDALAAGRPQAGESQETAGYRQAEAIMAICAEAAPVD